MQYAPAVTVSNAVHHLLEHLLRSVFVEMLSLLDVLQEVASVSILHHEEEVLGTLEHFEEADDVGVPDLLEDVDLLHDLLLGVSVLHVGLVDRLDSDLSTSELVDTEGDLPESTLADGVDEFVELLRCGRQLLILLDVEFVVPNEALPLLHDRIVDTESILVDDHVVNDLLGSALS